MNYKRMTDNQIAEHFSTISRQRISKLIEKYVEKGDTVVVEKMVKAKQILKKSRLDKKYGAEYSLVKYAKSLWAGINSRCGKVKKYKNCKNEFKNSKEFILWAVAQIGFGKENFEIDKDLLSTNEKKYSKDTCVFLPKAINAAITSQERRGGNNLPTGVTYNKVNDNYYVQLSMFNEHHYIGSYSTIDKAFSVYKEVKEKYLRELANIYKEEIDPRAYEALMNYQVEKWWKINEQTPSQP